MEDIKAALEIEPENKILLELQKKLKQDIKDYISTSKKVYGKMMEGEKDDEQTETKQEKIEEDHTQEVAKNDNQVKIEEKNIVTTEPESKVVEIHSDEEEDSSENESTQNIIEASEEIKEIRKDVTSMEKEESSTDKQIQLEERLERVEKMVEEIKYSMDILKGYGAIPLKMPDEEEKRKIDERQREAEQSRGKVRVPKEVKDKSALDEWVAMIALFILFLLISVGSSVILIRITSNT